MADVNTPPPLYGDPAEFSADERVAELEQARRLADRYRLEFVDMDTFRIDQELFRSIPADLMRQPPPAPDKGAIQKMLREGCEVPGAVLGNSRPVLTIRNR